MLVGSRATGALAAWISSFAGSTPSTKQEHCISGGTTTEVASITTYAKPSPDLLSYSLQRLKSPDPCNQRHTTSTHTRQGYTIIPSITTIKGAARSSASLSNLNQSTSSSLPAEPVSNVSPSLTNGESKLGLLDAPTYPKYLGSNANSHSPPWGNHNDSNTNPYQNSPDTGVTRYYDFTVSRGVLYPDGYRKDVLLVNGQFPGPVLEANWGDRVSITVHNNITGEAPQQTAIHWHGVLQHKTIWYDGAPGIVQCPIAPGDSLTYTWKAELYGTSWYHGHLSTQWPNGLLGPIIVYGPSHVAYDIDLGPIMLADWYHPSAEKVVHELLEPKPRFIDIPSDNNLINGRNPISCNSTALDGSRCLVGADYSRFKFEAGKSHRLRLINSGTQAVQKFSIDDHKMMIVANDFVPIEPYEVNVVTLGVGQRTDVIVRGDRDPTRSYWMRSTATCAEAKHPNALAVIHYANNRQPSKEVSTAKPTTQPAPDDSLTRNLICGNDPLELTVPVYRMPTKQPSTVINYEITFRQNSTGSWVWYMNNNSYLTDFSNPSLKLLAQNNLSYLLSDTPRKPYFIQDDATSYRFVVQNNSPSPHPIHYHGHNFHALYVSGTPWSETEAKLLDSRIVRPANPQRRDVQQVPAGGYLVIQVNADNPGAWGLHCHMAFHIGAGLFAELIEGKSKLLGRPIPDDIASGCQRWEAWNSRNPDLAKVWDSGQKL